MPNPININITDDLGGKVSVEDFTTDAVTFVTKNSERRISHKTKGQPKAAFQMDCETPP